MGFPAPFSEPDHSAQFSAKSQLFPRFGFYNSAEFSNVFEFSFSHPWYLLQ